jgi:Zn-dependent peptidase ImmA (M78 family)
MRVLRIPRQVTLPFGYIIKIVQLPDREYDNDVGADSLACWFSDEQIVYLRKNRPIRKRRADLAHEFLHACADWQVWLLATNQANVKE